MLTQALFAAVLVATMATAAAGQAMTPAQKAFQEGYAYHTGEKPNLEMALRHYHQAVKLDPSMFAALQNIALIYYSTKNYQSAINSTVFHKVCTSS